MQDLSRAARAAAHGDRDALNALVRATQGDVWRLCAHLTDPVAADDLAREAYLRALPRLRRPRGARQARTLLLAAAYQACDGHTAAPAPAAGPGQPAEAALRLTALVPDERGAFVLTQLLGCSYAEAAEISNCPPDAIRARVARARDALGSMTAPGSAGEGLTRAAARD